MNQAIQDSIRQGGVGDLGEPLDDGHLGNHNRGGMVEAVIENLQDILGIGLGERIAHPVVQDKQVGASQGAQQVRIGRLLASLFKGMEQAGGVEVAHRVAHAHRRGSEGASCERFS